jgi:hypothetical protein
VRGRQRPDCPRHARRQRQGDALAVIGTQRRARPIGRQFQGVRQRRELRQPVGFRFGACFDLIGGTSVSGKGHRGYVLRQIGPAAGDQRGIAGGEITQHDPERQAIADEMMRDQHHQMFVRPDLEERQTQ